MRWVGFKAPFFLSLFVCGQEEDIYIWTAYLVLCKEKNLLYFYMCIMLIDDPFMLPVHVLAAKTQLLLPTCLNQIWEFATLSPY